jgi:hypothetical protein
VTAKTSSSITTPVTLSFFVVGHLTKIRLITARTISQELENARAILLRHAASSVPCAGRTLRTSKLEHRAKSSFHHVKGLLKKTPTTSNKRQQMAVRGFPRGLSASLCTLIQRSDHIIAPGEMNRNDQLFRH